MPKAVSNSIPHRQHQIACREAGIPDLPSLIRVLALTGLGADLLAKYLAKLGRAGEVLVAVGRERLGFNIGEANIVERAAVEHRNDERTSPALGQLALQQKIGRQLVDGAADQLVGTEKDRPGERGIDALITAPSLR